MIASITFGVPEGSQKEGPFSLPGVPGGSSRLCLRFVLVKGSSLVSSFAMFLSVLEAGMEEPACQMVMNREVWHAGVRGAAGGQTRLGDRAPATKTSGKDGTYMTCRIGTLGAERRHQDNVVFSK